jgi:hypothetical protein
VQGCVGAFYARRAGEGKQILPVKSSNSVEVIGGHTRLSLAQIDAIGPTVSPLTPTRLHDFWEARTIQCHLTDLAREPLPAKTCDLTRYAYWVGVSLILRFLVGRPLRQRHLREMPPAAPWPPASRTEVCAWSPGLTAQTLAPTSSPQRSIGLSLQPIRSRSSQGGRPHGCQSSGMPLCRPGRINAWAITSLPVVYCGDISRSTHRGGGFS